MAIQARSCSPAGEELGNVYCSSYIQEQKFYCVIDVLNVRGAGCHGDKLTPLRRGWLSWKQPPHVFIH